MGRLHWGPTWRLSYICARASVQPVYAVCLVAQSLTAPRDPSYFSVCLFLSLNFYLCSLSFVSFYFLFEMRFHYVAQATLELMSQPLKFLNVRITVICHPWLPKEILQNIFLHSSGERVCVLVLALALFFHHVGPRGGTQLLRLSDKSTAPPKKP